MQIWAAERCWCTSTCLTLIRTVHRLLNQGASLGITSKRPWSALITPPLRFAPSLMSRWQELFSVCVATSVVLLGDTSSNATRVALAPKQATEQLISLSLAVLHPGQCVFLESRTSGATDPTWLETFCLQIWISALFFFFKQNACSHKALRGSYATFPSLSSSSLDLHKRICSHFDVFGFVKRFCYPSKGWQHLLVILLQANLCNKAIITTLQSDRLLFWQSSLPHTHRLTTHVKRLYFLARSSQ